LACKDEEELEEWMTAIQERIQATRDFSNITVLIPLYLVKEIERFKSMIFPKALILKLAKGNEVMISFFELKSIDTLKFLFYALKQSKKTYNLIRETCLAAENPFSESKSPTTSDKEDDKKSSSDDEEESISPLDSTHPDNIEFHKRIKLPESGLFFVDVFIG
jgi:hypothetical protein